MCGEWTRKRRACVCYVCVCGCVGRVQYLPQGGADDVPGAVAVRLEDGALEGLVLLAPHDGLHRGPGRAEGAAAERGRRETRERVSHEEMGLRLTPAYALINIALT